MQLFPLALPVEVLPPLRAAGGRAMGCAGVSPPPPQAPRASADEAAIATRPIRVVRRFVFTATQLPDCPIRRARYWRRHIRLPGTAAMAPRTAVCYSTVISR